MWVKVTKSWVHSVSKPLHLENPPLQDLRWHRKQSLRPQGEGGCDPWRTPCFSQRSGSWVLFPKNRFFTGKRKNKTNKGKDLKYNWLQDGVMYFFFGGGRGCLCVYFCKCIFVGGPWTLIRCRFELDSHGCKGWKFENDIPYGQSTWHGPQNIG